MEQFRPYVPKIEELPRAEAAAEQPETPETLPEIIHAVTEDEDGTKRETYEVKYKASRPGDFYITATKQTADWQEDDESRPYSIDVYKIVSGPRLTGGDPTKKEHKAITNMFSGFDSPEVAEAFAAELPEIQRLAEAVGGTVQAKRQRYDYGLMIVKGK